MSTSTSTLPSLREGIVEIQKVEDEVLIYATEEGLRSLIDLCERLLKKPKQGHIHVEDYSILTKESLRCVLVKVDKPA